MDFFRRIDKDQDGKVTRQEFIEGILSSSKRPAHKPINEQRGTISRNVNFVPRDAPQQSSLPAAWR